MLRLFKQRVEWRPPSGLFEPAARDAFRVLGLGARAAHPEVFDAASALRLALKVGVRKTFEADAAWLGEVARKESDVRDAVGRLSEPGQRARERLFWFHLAPPPAAVSNLSAAPTPPPAATPAPAAAAQANSQPSYPPFEGDRDRFMKAVREIDPKGALVVGASKGRRETNLVITVADGWHYQPYQMRLQAAQNLWSAWAKIRSPSDVDKARISIVDMNGNEVGGSRMLAGSLIWVQEK